MELNGGFARVKLTNSADHAKLVFRAVNTLHFRASIIITPTVHIKYELHHEEIRGILRPSVSDII